MLPSLSECLGRVEATGPNGKLEGLDLWLSARQDAALCVGSVRDERRCTVRVHGRTFGAMARGGGFEATWRAIGNAIRRAEAFERAAGADVG